MRLGRCRQHELFVAAPPLFTGVQRDPFPNRNEDILESRMPRVMSMDVARGDGSHPERRRELAQGGVATRIATCVRTLELDEEPFAAERLHERRDVVRAPHAKPVTSAPGQADEAIISFSEQRGVKPRVASLRTVRGCQEPAEVRIALRGLKRAG